MPKSSNVKFSSLTQSVHLADCAEREIKSLHSILSLVEFMVINFQTVSHGFLNWRRSDSWLWFLRIVTFFVVEGRDDLIRWKSHYGSKIVLHIFLIIQQRFSHLAELLPPTRHYSSCKTYLGASKNAKHGSNVPGLNFSSRNFKAIHWLRVQMTKDLCHPQLQLCNII